MGAEKREECCSPDPEWKTCGDCTPCGKCFIKGTVLLVVVFYERESTPCGQCFIKGTVFRGKCFIKETVNLVVSVLSKGLYCLW